MEHRMKTTQKAKVIYSACSILILVALICWIYYKTDITNYSDFVDSIIGILSLFVAAVSVVLIMAQLMEARTLQEAEFIVHLNQTFVDNASYAKMYSELEKSDREHIAPALSRIEVSNYLTLFETIYLLVENGAIKMKTLDDLFAYRFFLAVHNESVQKMKLVDAPYNFRNIYYLEYIWIKYREEREFPVYKIENCLFQACKKAGKEEQYNDIINNHERKRIK